MQIGSAQSKEETPATYANPQQQQNPPKGRIISGAFRTALHSVSK
jgi:hypothetical protein